MLTLGLTLTLLAAPSARLLPESEVLLSDDEIVELRKQLNIVEAQIREIKPRMPGGFIVGAVIGFTISVFFLPGVPLVIAGGLSGTSALLAIGGVLSGIGGVGLLIAVICLIAGNNAEMDLADERARLVEVRDQLKARLGSVSPNAPQPVVPPPYVPGVQRDVPPRLITVARF